MNPGVKAVAAVFWASAGAACSGPLYSGTPIGSAPTSLPAAAPTPTPTAVPTPGPLSVSRSNLSFDATGGSQTVTLTDPGYSGAYTVGGCIGIAAATISGQTVTVTSVAAGICVLTVRSGVAQTATISVTVSIVSMPIT
jgi:hypothetical protein